MMSRSLSSAMPMPVSVTVTLSSYGVSSGAAAMRSSTWPASVNLNALESRLRSTCCRRCSSVKIDAGAPSSVWTSNSMPFCSATEPNARPTYSAIVSSSSGPGVISIFPASTLDRSRMSEMSDSRSAPAVWIVEANSICFSVRFCSGFSASSLERISSEFSGVRSSWLMFARNSDLYFELIASWAACPSRSARARSISAFWISMSRFWTLSSSAFSCSSSLVCWSSSCWVCSSSSEARSDCVCCSSSELERLSSCCWDCSSSDWDCSSSASDWDCSSSSSVRRLAMIAFSTTPSVSASCSRKAWLTSENSRSEASSTTAMTCSSNRIGMTMMFFGCGVAEARGDLDVVRRRVGDEDALALERRLADERLAELEAVGDGLSLLVAVARDEAQLGVGAVVGLGEEEGAVLRRDERRDLGHDHPRHRREVALALHEPGDPREVRVQPVLLGVLLRRPAQVGDHLVDRVRQLGDLALGLDGHLAGQVALRHGGRHLGDRAHLRREVAGELVDVLGEVAPGAADALDLRPGRRACRRCRPRARRV